MNVALDQLESLWPPYRGAVLLGAARESQGRVSNTRVAVVAGHVALSLEVDSPTSTRGARGDHQPADTVTAVSTSPPVAHGPRSSPSPSPALRLTVLLDAVPDSAPKPGTHPMARFLTKVLSQTPEEAGDRKEEEEEDGVGSGSRPGGEDLAAVAELPRREEGLLGKDVPEMLVVEHIDEVVLSEFVRFEHKADPRTSHGKSSTGVGSNNLNNSSSSLLYACVEANGLLRLWRWGAEGAGWSWSFLNRCNICACREDPIGCRVLAAAMVPEPGEGSSRVGNRHRLVWEQEDGGEGAGLGLASIPAAGTRPPRRVWSRRVTYDLEDGDTGDGHGSQVRQEQRYRQEDEGEEESEEKRSVFGSGGGGNTRAEIALAFSACLMPTGVDALLCSEVGVWMPTGTRVFFNHFATGRLPEVVVPVLPARPFPAGGHNTGDRAAGAENDGDELGASKHGSESGAFMDAESNPENGVYAPDGGDNAGGAGEGGAARKTSGMAGQDAAKGPPARRLFSVHDSTSDLMVYDHPGAIRAVSFSLSGEGGLRLGVQCTLDPPPPLPPSSFMARFNVAVLCGGGLCSAYDLCTGNLLGAATVPRCPSCAFRRRHRAASSASASSCPSCTCGRRHPSPVPAATAELIPGFAAAVPALWNSRTRGHLAGVLTATQVLRIRLPTAETCLAAMLHSSGKGGSVASAPRVLRYAREHRRLVGAAGDACPASLLPEVLLAQGLRSGRGGPEPAGVRTVELLGHALAAEERGWPVGNGNHRGSLPPWLLVAMMSSEQRGGETPGLGAATDRERAIARDGDPAAAAAEMTLRTTLERRVSESLRSLDAVRALLQDPAASARQDTEGGGLRAAEDKAAEKLASLTASVDPATALFEGTLREWLACGAATRKDAGSCGDGEASARGGRGVSLRGQGGEEHVLDAGSLGRASDDALALAFRCEAAGDAEAMAIPFLHFLLEESVEEPGHAPGGASGGDGGGGTLAPSSSTFLCIHLAGNVSSPLFEVACRALFRLRARKLPRFVERLSRFRAYAAAMSNDLDVEEDGDSGGGGDGESGDEENLRRQRRRERRHERIPSDARSETAGDAGAPGKGATTALSARGGSSTASAVDRTDENLTPSLRSASPPPSPSRRASENSGSASGDLLGSGSDARAGRGSNRPTSATSRECSPDPVSASTPCTLSALPDTKNSDAPASHDEKPNASISPIAARALSAPAYFSRALACLPPAAEDGGDGAQRRARLALLMGACMFTDACGLLRARSWEGSGGSWRGDRGAAEAWGAAVRLLGELKRAAAEGEERKEAATAAGDGAATADLAPAAPAAAGTAGPLPPVYGDVVLQFRLAFEDALAETILADCPERMEAVMGCRPNGLTPVAVVRMVRRAAEAAAVATAAVSTGGGCDVQPPVRTGVGGQSEGVHHPALRGSTQTLKRCLLLLLEDQ